MAWRIPAIDNEETLAAQLSPLAAQDFCCAGPTCRSTAVVLDDRCVILS
jgi:hypothetical protein